MATKIEFIPPGFDPTTEEYKIDGPSCSGCLTVIVAVCAALGIGGILMSMASNRPATAPTLAVIPTSSATSLPTSTGTITPLPPSLTPTNTPTLNPSETPTFIPPPTQVKVKPVITATPNGATWEPVFTATSLVQGAKYVNPPTPTPKRITGAKYVKPQRYIAPTETPVG